MAVTAERVGDRMLEPGPATARFFVIMLVVAVIGTGAQLVGHKSEGTVFRTDDLIAKGSQ